MSLLSKAPALVLFALAAAPFAGCGSSNPHADTCSGLCQAALACVDPSRCVVADPAGTQEACIQTCEAGYAGLTPAESDLVTACLSCAINAASGKCVTAVSGSACDAACKSADASAAGEKFTQGLSAAPPSAASQCTNGMNLIGSTSCEGSGDPTSCTQSCCNGASCATPDVAVQCTTSSPAMCTCTFGKNTGKTFSSPQGCGVDLWTECNL
jgi:hypothetical protein